jgi:Protein of unknown function (DUF1559)
MGSIGGRLGFHDRALVSDLDIDAPAPRTGLLALADQAPITLSDLPPLPNGTNFFAAGSCDWSKVYDDVVKIARDFAKTTTNDGVGKVDAFVDHIPAVLGFDLKRHLLDALGPVTCCYNDNSGALFGFGFQIAIRVREPETLKKTLNTAFEKLQSHFPNGFSVSENERAGRTVQVLSFGQVPMIHPALVVDKNWLFIGLSAQAVEASLLRVDGKLDVWKASPVEQEALDSVPKRFQALSLSDPRSTYSGIVTYLPVAMVAIDQAMQGGARNRASRAAKERMSLVSELPPAEVMTRSLFPDVSAWTVDERGIHSKSRDSAPGLVSAGNPAVIAMTVALLLPAVQAAREAARRTESRNHLRQIMLALHNYHDVHGHFPAGTHPNPKLKPDKRLSWLADLLPFLELQNVHNQIDFEKAWDDVANRKPVTLRLNIFLNPSARATSEGQYPVTNYVGMAGLGADGPTLPVTSPRAGFFADDRVTRIRDITDGTSTTIAVMEVSKNCGSWAAGGLPTIRALTAKPYINGPDGFGGDHTGVVLAAMADGSVRAISERVDPRVLEALVTICGGEAVSMPTEGN